MEVGEKQVIGVLVPIDGEIGDELAITGGDVGSPQRVRDVYDIRRLPDSVGFLVQGDCSGRGFPPPQL